MGRRKWKVYQDSLASSHMNAADLLANKSPSIGKLHNMRMHKSAFNLHNYIIVVTFIIFHFHLFALPFSKEWSLSR